MHAGVCAAALCVAIAIGAGSVAAQEQTPKESKSELTKELLAPIHTSPDVAPGMQVYQILPSDVDPSIKRFNKPNIVLVKDDLPPTANLLVFFPGTGGDPNMSLPFLIAGANAGYRVIGLMYDNGVSDPQTCGPNPDPACSDRFREKRIFGDAESADIDDLPNESIENRLMKLLHYLDQLQPDQHWGRYLTSGLPNWSRIAVAGHSQGGGVAAYIGKNASCCA
jgi:predicted esterase